MQRISEGLVNNFLIPGVFIALAGVICVVVGWGGIFQAFISGIILIVISVLLLTASSGLEVDSNSKCYRKYGKFGLLVLGNWKSIPEAVEVQILINVESAQRQYSLFPFPTHKSKVITYEVWTVDTLGGRTRIYGFLEYKNAERAGSVLSEATSATLNDIVRNRLSSNRSKRR
ncbi:MAG: hypothetical protein ACFHU9_04715 [Fluviicola sp.]